MTIRPVHVEGALTKAEYDALNLSRPLCDGPIGSTTIARRSADEAASRAWDEPDRPAVTSKRRAVGPARTALQPDDGDTARNAARRAQYAAQRRNGVKGTPIAAEPEIVTQEPA